MWKRVKHNYMKGWFFNPIYQAFTTSRQSQPGILPHLRCNMVATLSIENVAHFSRVHLIVIYNHKILSFILSIAIRRNEIFITDYVGLCRNCHVFIGKNKNCHDIWLIFTLKYSFYFEMPHKLIKLIRSGWITFLIYFWQGFLF